MSNVSIKIFVIVGLAMAIFVMFNKSTVQYSDGENNKIKTTPMTIPEISNKPLKSPKEVKGFSDTEYKILLKNQKIEKEITTVDIPANNPDNFGNEQAFIDTEPVSIGEFIPAIPRELVESEKEYEASKTGNGQTEAEIQAEFEILNNEINAGTVGKEIGDYIPVDAVPDNAPSEGVEIGEFISAEPSLL